MTQNQLKYWELRWKQHYEKILAEVKVREAEETERHNRAVEQETARHNRREERIDTQNMIVNRQNLEARWAELKERTRAAIVAEQLNEKKYQLAVQQELRETQYTKAQINKMLSDVKVASMEMAMSIVKNKHDIAANYIKAEAALLKNGWTKAAAGKVISGIESLMSSSEFDKLFDQMTKDPTFSWITETFGPAKSETVSSGNNSDSTQTNPNTTTKDDFKPPTGYAIKGDGGVKVLGFSGTETTTNSGSSTGVTVSDGKKVGSTSEAVTVREPSKGSAGVIYSPGSHYGPGWNI